MIQATNTPGWLGVAGMVIGALLMICSLEYVGSFEQEGWKLAATVTPIAYIAWSVWLIAIGVTLLLSAQHSGPARSDAMTWAN